MALSLYELTGKMLELQDMLDSGEYDEETLNDTLESVEAVIEDKADGYAKIIANLTASTEAITIEIKRLNDRMKSYDKAIQRLRDNLKESMIVTGKTKFKTDLFSFSVAANPPKLVIDDQEDIPIDYQIVKKEILVDKAALKEALKSGKLIMGCHLEQGTSLRIK